MAGPRAGLYPWGRPGPTQRGGPHTGAIHQQRPQALPRESCRQQNSPLSLQKAQRTTRVASSGPSLAAAYLKGPARGAPWLTAISWAHKHSFPALLPLVKGILTLGSMTFQSDMAVILLSNAPWTGEKSFCYSPQAIWIRGLRSTHLSIHSLQVGRLDILLTDDTWQNPFLLPTVAILHPNITVGLDVTYLYSDIVHTKPFPSVTQPSALINF